MFKKIEIWILYLVLLIGFLFTISFGTLVRQELVGNMKLGIVSKGALFLAEIPVTIRMIFKDSELKSAESRFENFKGFEGAPSEKEMYLLLSKFDGDIKEGIVELVDLTNFDRIHVWNPNFDEMNKLAKNKGKEFQWLDRDYNDSRARLKHPYLTTNGELIFLDTSPLRSINECSELLWQNTDDLFHHSIEVDHNGNFWVPTHIYPQSISKKKIGTNTIYEDGYFDDAIVKVSKSGKILYQKSVSQIFIENDMEYLLFSALGGGFKADPIHLNDIQPVMSNGNYWKKGDVFISLRHQSMIILFRPSTNQIIWKSAGKFYHQHDIDILDENRISIFNNNSKNFYNGDIVDGSNEVIIYDFEKDQYDNFLDEQMKDYDIRTNTNGRNEILPDGSLLVEETNFGRTLFFNSDGTLRWAHYNRADDNSLYRVGWSRLLYRDEDIESVRKFIANKKDCKR